MGVMELITEHKSHDTGAVPIAVSVNQIVCRYFMGVGSYPVFHCDV